jgi:hypothetical protein
MYFTFKYIQIHSKNCGDVILKIRDADRLGGQRSQVPPDRERVENRSTGYLAHSVLLSATISFSFTPWFSNSFITAKHCGRATSTRFAKWRPRNSGRSGFRKAASLSDFAPHAYKHAYRRSVVAGEEEVT